MVRTLALMLFALLPTKEGAATVPRGADGVRRLEPRELRGGMDRYLDEGGEFVVFFPGCRALAAPFVMFRLKRTGFSRCLVEEADGGLWVRGRR